MDNVRRDIIESLVFCGPRSCADLARALDYELADVLAEVRKLAEEFLVVYDEGAWCIPVRYVGGSVSRELADEGEEIADEAG